MASSIQPISCTDVVVDYYLSKSGGNLVGLERVLVTRARTEWHLGMSYLTDCKAQA